jgi:Na+/H+-dicarboxylate symporter
MKEKKKLSLPIKIFIGMALGIIAGLIFAFAHLGEFTKEWIKPIGTIYVNLLKFLVVPVVLFSIADGVISLNDLKRVGSVGLKTFVYYMATTALAVVIGLALVNIFKGAFTPLPSADIEALTYEAKEAPSVMQVIVNIFPSNLVQPMVTSDMLPIIVIAIFLGAGCLAAGEKGAKIANLINCGQEVVMKIMMMIISFTPIGVFCLMTNVVAENGPQIIGKLALIIGVAYLGYIIHVLVVYGLSVRFLSKMSPIKFFKGIAPAMITAFTTTSSNATLPVNIECCNKMGAEPEISAFVLPLGATINMDGTAIYQAVCTVFIACCYGRDLSLGDMAMIVLTATLASVGTAGTPGAGMIMLAMVLTQVGLPVEGIAIIAGVDKLFDMGRTTLNITGDATCALWISRVEREKKARMATKANK